MFCLALLPHVFKNCFEAVGNIGVVNEGGDDGFLEGNDSSLVAVDKDLGG